MIKLFVFDCDDILLDWCAGMREYLITKYPSIKFNTYYPVSYDLDGWIASDLIPPASEFIDDFANSVYFEHLPAVDMAVECIQLLRSEANRVADDVEFCVLTKCGLGTNGLTLLKRVMNIENTFGKNIFDNIYVIETYQSKHSILEGLNQRYHILGVVDDNVHNNYISSCLNLPSYMLRRSHNMKASLPTDVVVCEDWEELYSNLYHQLLAG